MMSGRTSSTLYHKAFECCLYTPENKFFHYFRFHLRNSLFNSLSTSLYYFQQNSSLSTLASVVIYDFFCVLCAPCATKEALNLALHKVESLRSECFA
ncbi:unnamed protein product [Ceratitis capitata]|uniref:(Mediterranean fruit fly) hypothetical protein n=1 Tax=Ceratitis capitata TaxID=7213 RepID=A0A811UW71_CERCA|nr:unnamed protein product [Ceratitis capitata]